MAAVIKIEVISQGGGAAVAKDIDSIGDAAKSAGGKLDAMREIGIGALRAIGTMGVDLAVKGLQAVAGAISDGIEDAKANAIIQAQTAAVIKSTGEAAGVSAQHVADYASSLSDAAGKSLFGDDQIQQSTNLLLTFTEIKGTVLDAATAISVDMAQAMGGAPKDAAIQLGKALNDPIKGITALTRVGVTFSEEQKAQIQAMQEAGDTAGAQAVILAELNKEFGGSAEAAAAATGGWSEFNGRMGEAKETLGAAVLPLLNQLAGVLIETVMPIVESAAAGFADFVAFLSDLGASFQSADEWSSSMAETIATLAAQLVGFFAGVETGTPAFWALQGAFQSVTDSVQFFIDNLSELAPVFAILQGVVATALPSIQLIVTQVFGIISGFIEEHGAKILADVQQVWGQVQSITQAVLPPIQAIVNQVFGAIAQFLAAHGEDIKTFIGTTWDAIANIIKMALALIQAIIVPVLTFIASFISAHGVEIQALLSNTWNAIKAVIDIALTLIQGVLKAALQVIQGDWSGAWTTIKEMCARIVTDLVTVIQSGLNNAITLFGNLADQVISILSALPGQAAQLGSDIIDGIISGVSAAAGALYSMLQDIASNALQAAKDALGISSPSDVFASEVGAPIIAGLILGVQSMIPGLIGVLDDVAITIISHAKKVTEKVVDEANKIQDALLDQAAGIADKLGNVMADALSGEAGLSRAKAKAIGALKDISAAQQAEVQKQLAAASTTAGGFGDPKQAAAFFKMRSDQIFELAKIRDQIDKATDEAAKARLVEQFNLIGLAQQKELQAFDTKASGKSPLETITEKIQALLANPNLPGQFDGAGGTNVLGALFQALPQLIAMTGGNNPSANNTTNSNQFTYAPTITTSGPIAPPLDHATARALAGV